MLAATLMWIPEGFQWQTLVVIQSVGAEQIICVLSNFAEVCNLNLITFKMQTASGVHLHGVK